MKKHHVEVMLQEDVVDARIKELGEQISRELCRRKCSSVCILKGSVYFTCRAGKENYRAGDHGFHAVLQLWSRDKSSGIVKIVKDLDEPIIDRNVIIIEDIIDSGRTLSHLKKLLAQRSPKSLKICTLLDKPDRRVVDVPVEYVGFQIEDKFVVGYGLDYDQQYRNLPYIGVVQFD